MAAGGTCAKCGGRMEQGFVLDHSDNHGKRVSGWVEGAPERGWFRPLKLRGKRQLEVQTWRCTRCGYLESYAPS